MRVANENKLFEYFRKEHNVLLTRAELDEIEGYIEADNYDHVKETLDRINWYRVINVLAFLILFLIGWDWGLRIVVGLFILYNVIHIVAVNISLRNWRKNKIKALRDERRRRRI